MKPIRNSVKAIIIQDRHILLTKNKDPSGIFYLLPGGGQEKEENMIEALERECMEEISSKIQVGDIRFVRDYIGRNHEFAEFDANIHQIEYMFECKLISREEPKNGNVPDQAQVGVEWIPLRELKSIRIYPSILKECIHEDGTLHHKIYLGDVN